MTERDEAFSEFVLATARSLRRTAYLVCGDWHQADDALQVGLHRLYLAWPRVERTRSAYGYARRVVVNAAIDAGRRPWRREQTASELPESATADPADQHADRELVLGALRLVPPRQRACVVLRYYDGLSVDETATVLGCSAATVRSQTTRGLSAMQRILTGQPASAQRR